MATTKSIFATLSSIAVRDKIERKGQLDYLSWANAWAMLKTKYPKAQRKVYEHDHTGLNYFTDGNYAYVKVGIVVDDIEHIDYLPVMDYRNKSIKIDSLTSMDVNKTIQRSTAKAIAMHGLGLSLWTGEDLPEVTPIPTQKKTIELNINDDNWDKVLKYIGANKELGLTKIVDQLQRKYNVTPKVKTEIKKLIK